MKRILMRSVFFFTVGTALAFATADGPDFLQTRNLKKGEVLCLHKDHNISSPAIGCILAPAHCLKNLGYFPETGDAPPSLETIVWVKVEQSNSSLIGWGMVQWLGEDSNCSNSKK